MNDERPRRAYHSPLRQQRAAARRDAILEAAADCFAAKGWNGTTMTAIAERAETSVETVYGVGPKAFLLLESFRRRYLGDGGWSSMLEHPTAEAFLAITEREEALRFTCEFLVDAHSASAELWMVIRAAAPTDERVLREFDELQRLRRESFGVTVDWMARVGIVPAPSDDAARHRMCATVATLMSAETWLELTSDWGLDATEYQDWIRHRLTTIDAPDVR